MKKIGAIAGLLGLLVAILAAFMTMPMDAAMLMVVLGVIAGIAYDMDRMVGLMLAVLVYPIAGTTLGAIPTIGEPIGAILTNIGVVAAGAAATVLVRRVIEIVQANIGELTGKSAS